MARMLKVIRVKISLYFNFTARRKGMKLQFYRGFIFFMYYRGSSYRVPTVFFFFFFYHLCLLSRAFFCKNIFQSFFLICKKINCFQSISIVSIPI